MATTVRIKFNPKGFKELLSDPGVQADLMRRAEAIATAASDGDGGLHVVRSGAEPKQPKVKAEKPKAKKKKPRRKSAKPKSIDDDEQHPDGGSPEAGESKRERDDRLRSEGVDPAWKRPKVAKRSRARGAKKGQRARAAVVTADFAAVRAESERGNLTRSIDAGR